MKTTFSQICRYNIGEIDALAEHINKLESKHAIKRYLVNSFTGLYWILKQDHISTTACYMQCLVRIARLLAGIGYTKVWSLIKYRWSDLELDLSDIDSRLRKINEEQRRSKMIQFCFYEPNPQNLFNQSNLKRFYEDWQRVVKDAEPFAEFMRGDLHVSNEKYMPVLSDEAPDEFGIGYIMEA